MVEITFEYKDYISLAYDNKPRVQHSICESVEECVKMYGLNECYYWRILSVKNVD